MHCEEKGASASTTMVRMLEGLYVVATHLSDMPEVMTHLANAVEANAMEV